MFLWYFLMILIPRIVNTIYVANGRGMCICSEDIIRVDNADGEEEHIPWTLQTYIKLSTIRYASKARFYCVKKYVEGMLL